MQEQRFQLLGFAIGQQQRIVFGEVPSLLRPRPGTSIPRDAAGSALDLHQIDLVQRHHQQIDFIDAAV
jgi:hypothetical protein